MGIRRTCDWFGAGKDVKAYKLIIEEVPLDTEGSVDLCPRGYKRAVDLMKKASRDGATVHGRPLAKEGKDNADG